MEVRAYYELPTSIIIHPDCLGESLPIRLLGYRGVLFMPSITWNTDNDPRLIAPELSHTALAMLKQHTEAFSLWGSISSWNPKDKTFTAARLSSFLFTLELDKEHIIYSDYLYGRGHPMSADIEKLGKNIDEWFGELCAWISVKTRQDLNYDHPLSSVKMPGNSLRIWTEERQITSLIATPNTIIASIVGDVAKKALHKADLIKIVGMINNGKRPPDNHLFLRDARDANLRHQARKAAIDAGTAVEITLREYAMANNITIRNTPPPMLGWYVHNTAPNLPSDTQTKLVDVRNDATHYNLSFDDALVPRAVEIATQIVEDLSPLVI